MPSMFACCGGAVQRAPRNVVIPENAAPIHFRL
jgi:hypothetical protein